MRKNYKSIPRNQMQRNTKHSKRKRDKSIVHRNTETI